MKTGDKFLFFDTETTGLPKDWKAPVQQVDNWPRIIQLAYMVYEVDERLGPVVRANKNILIKPDGWEVPKERFWIDNGFTQEDNLKHGIPIIEALGWFIGFINKCDYLVAHNMSFDAAVIGAEMIRANVKADKQIKRICTKVEGTNYCNIPHANGRGVKWPTLNELHIKCFDKGFEGAHDAKNDVKACADCFFSMITDEVIRL